MTERRVIVRCVHGLEWVCAAELARLGSDVGRPTLDRRELTVEVTALDPALLDLSTADDAYLEVGRVDGTGTGAGVPAELATRLVRLPWPDRLADVGALRPVPDRPLIDVVASLEGRRNYNRFAVENAAGAALAGLTGGTYLERTAAGRAPGEPDLTARLLVRGDVTIAAVRLSRRPLHRRDYKLDTAAGTLHPPVAAALARLADPGPGEQVLDPFCGDGTIAIETARARPGTRVRAADLDPERVANAGRNAERAGVTLELAVADAGAPSAAGTGVDVVITNPPWNRVVAGAGSLAGSLGPFWAGMPELLTGRGRLVAVADAERDLPAALRAAGLRVAVTARIRLAGRLSDVVLAAPAGRPRPELAPDLAAAHERAAAGVVPRF